MDGCYDSDSFTGKKVFTAALESGLQCYHHLLGRWLGGVMHVV